MNPLDQRRMKGWEQRGVQYVQYCAALSICDYLYVRLQTAERQGKKNKEGGGKISEEMMCSERRDEENQPSVSLKNVHREEERQPSRKET